MEESPRAWEVFVSVLPADTGRGVAGRLLSVCVCIIRRHRSRSPREPGKCLCLFDPQGPVEESQTNCVVFVSVHITHRHRGRSHRQTVECLCLYYLQTPVEESQTNCVVFVSVLPADTGRGFADRLCSVCVCITRRHRSRSPRQTV